MDYFRLNFYSKEKAIYKVIFFVGNYITSSNSSIESLRKSIESNNYDSVKNLITKSEFNFFAKHSIPLKFVNDNIYDDDTVYDIKQKIINEYNEILLEEIYIYGENEIISQIDNLFISHSNRTNMISNLSMKELSKNITLDIDINKDEYSFTEFNELGFNKSPLNQFIPIGIQFRDDISTNPFNFYNIQGNVSTKRSLVENNKLLSDYNLTSQTLHIVLLKDMDEINDMVVNSYYPMLTQYGIDSYEVLLKQSKKIKQTVYNIIDDNTINKFHNTKMFYDYSSIQVVESFKISTINVFVRSFNNITLPLERIFKQFSTSREIPLIKFNPGHKKEYIFRMHSINTTKENVRIPFVNKSIINRYLHESKGKSNLYITFFIYIDDITLCNVNIYETGDYEVFYENRRKSMDSNKLEILIRSKVESIMDNIRDMSLITSSNSYNKFIGFSHKTTYVKDMNYSFEFLFFHPQKHNY